MNGTHDIAATPAWPPAAENTNRFVAGFATTAAIVVALLFLSHWPGYNYLILGGSVPFRYYILPGLFALFIALLRPSAPIRLLSDPLLWWFVIYALTGMAWLLLSQDYPVQALTQWKLRMWALFFFATIALLSVTSRRTLVAAVIVAMALLACALNWFDVLRPNILVPPGAEGFNPGRGAGLFVNANGAAAFICMATIAALPFVPMRFRAALLIVCAVGVAPTFSRFGIIFMALLVAAAVFMKLLDRRQVFILLAAVPLLLTTAELYYEFIVKSRNENILGRLAWFESMGRIGDYSTREREWVAEQAWRQFLDNPVIGNGLGGTIARGQRVGTHNMYLMLMAEQGIIGLALYLSLIWLLFRRGRRIVRRAVDATDRDVGRAMVLSALYVALYGAASHNVLEEPHGMFLLAFVAAAGFHAMRRAREAAWMRA